jgi:hypothetical protein
LFGKPTFLRLLEFTPQIGFYVRDLLVYSYAVVLQVDPERLDNFWLSLENLSKLHITTYNHWGSGILVALLSSLPSLKELSLDLWDFDPGDRPLITVPNKIQSLVITLDPNFLKWSIDGNIFPQIQNFECRERKFIGGTEVVVLLHKFLKEYCSSLVHVRLAWLKPTLSERM